MKLTRIELAGIIFVSVILVTRIEDEARENGSLVPVTSGN
jgi:hypothetical protein